MLIRLGRGMAPEQKRAVSFSPAQITDLSIWYDASDPAAIQHTGGLVSQWLDKSGNGNHAVQNNAAWRPVTGLRTINGTNVLDFNLKYFDVVSPNISFFDSDFIVLAVIERNATNENQRILRSLAVTSGVLQISVDSGTLVSGRCTNSWGVADSPAGSPDTAPYIIGMQKSGSTVRLFAKGGNFSASHSDPTNHEVAGVTSLRIGLENEGFARFRGTIAEILIYRRSLSNAEMNSLGAYLSTKWGIAWTAF